MADDIKSSNKSFISNKRWEIVKIHDNKLKLNNVSRKSAFCKKFFARTGNRTPTLALEGQDSTFKLSALLWKQIF